MKRRVLAASVIGAAACTDPSFPNVDAGGRGGRAASAADAASATASDSSAPDATPAGDAGLDAGERDAGPGAGDAALQQADAGSAGEHEAAATPDDLPSWARPLLGRYVKRSINVGYDDIIGMTTAAVEVSLIDIARTDAGDIELTSQLCSLFTQWLDGGAKLTLAQPSSVAPLKLRILLGDAPHFSSSTAVQPLGFEPERQSSCEGGAARPAKFPDQGWIPGTTCTCPETPELLPMTSSDCRLTDPDGDRKPGVTLNGSGVAPTTEAIAMTTTLKIVDGEVRADREHVFHEQRSGNLACVYSAVDGCGVGSNTPCPQQETLVLPLEAGANCEAALGVSNPIPVPVVPQTDCRTGSP